MTIRLTLGKLTAAEGDRAATGLLLPHGETGDTNIGKVKSQHGAITLPEDITILNLNSEHNPLHPVGRFTTAEDTEQGITAGFRLAANPEGDAILDAITAGSPPALSVELADVTITETGTITAAKLAGAAIVQRPAFKSATLVATEPSHAKEQEHPMPNPDTTTQAAAVPAPIPNQATPAPVKPAETFEKFLAAFAQGDMHAPAIKAAANLFGTLADNKFDGTGTTGDATHVPQWLAELWHPAADTRQIIPLFKKAALTALTYHGFRWATKPTVERWAGNKTEIPSSGGTTEQVTGQAVRFAGGFDSAIEFRHFGQTALIEQLVKFLIEDYATKSDAWVLTEILKSATAARAGTVAAGVAPALSWIIDGALTLLGDNITPSFALVNPADWREVILSPKDHRLEFIQASFGLESGNTAGFTIRPHKGITKGKALVGTKNAVTVLELPGAPVRVSALDIARGGVDDAVFGYVGVIIEHPHGLQLVSAASQ